MPTVIRIAVGNDYVTCPSCRLAQVPQDSGRCVRCQRALGER